MYYSTCMSTRLFNIQGSVVQRAILSANTGLKVKCCILVRSNKSLLCKLCLMKPLSLRSSSVEKKINFRKQVLRFLHFNFSLTQG